MVSVSKLKKKKKQHQLYSKYSAPITDGILRNGKCTKYTGGDNSSNGGRIDDRKVTFTLHCAQTQLCIDDIRAAIDALKVDEKPQRKEKNGQHKTTTSIDTDSGTKQKVPKRRLSFLLDKKIEMKMRRNSQEDYESDEQTSIDALPVVHRPFCPSKHTGQEGRQDDKHKYKDRPRRRLSLLLDERIQDKMRRTSSL